MSNITELSFPLVCLLVKILLFLLSSDSQLLQHVKLVNVPFACSQLSWLAYWLSMNLLRNVNFPYTCWEVSSFHALAWKFPCACWESITFHVLTEKCQVSMCLLRHSLVHRLTGQWLQRECAPMTSLQNISTALYSTLMSAINHHT